MKFRRCILPARPLLYTTSVPLCKYLYKQGTHLLVVVAVPASAAYRMAVLDQIFQLFTHHLVHITRGDCRSTQLWLSRIGFLEFLWVHVIETIQGDV